MPDLYLFLYSSTNYYWKADSHWTESLLCIQWLVRSKGDANELIVCINSKGCFLLWFMSCMDMRGKHFSIYLFYLFVSIIKKHGAVFASRLETVGLWWSMSAGFWVCIAPVCSCMQDRWLWSNMDPDWRDVISTSPENPVQPASRCSSMVTLELLSRSLIYVHIDGQRFGLIQIF